MANTNGDSTSSEDSWFVPNFSEGFKGTRLQQGHDAEFRAVASGKPKPKVSWTKNGETLSTSDKYVLSYNTESGQVSLLIRNLGPGDEGTYSCTVSNAYGTTTATLSVNPDANNKTGPNCFGPGCTRATLQRQHVLKQMQSQGGSTIDNHSSDSTHARGGLAEIQGL